MPILSFGINWDYRCPFARNMHEHLVTALAAGAPWSVRFIPFSLSQVHIEEGETSVWEDPSRQEELSAVMVGMVVNREFPERFYETHLALFRARHDDARDIASREVLSEILRENGVPPEKVWNAIEEGWPLAAFQEAHEHSVSALKVFGVPTLFIDDQAAFVRVMTRPNGDAAKARSTVDAALATLIDHPEFNEIKFTTISR
ncbi:MAG: DsbA family oxidoreductase [Ferrimicrobium sp.]